MLTSCFQQTVLVAVPCGFLWLFGFLKTFRRKPDVHPYPWTLLSILKVFITATLILLSALEFGLLFQRDSGSSGKLLPLMSFISVALKIVTYILALVLQVGQKIRREVSSSELFLFWFLLTFCEIWATPVFQVLQSEGNVEMSTVQFVVASLSFPLMMCELVLSAFRDPSPTYLWNGKKEADPVTNQTLLSRWTFSYMDRLLWYGHRNNITLEDLEYFGSRTCARFITERLLKYWIKEENKLKHGTKISGEHPSEEASRKSSRVSGKPSLCRALFRTMWPVMALSGLVEIIVSFTILVPPIILDLLIKFTDNDELQWHGYVYAVALFLSSVVTTFLRINNLDILIPASLVPRLGLSAVVYRKTLKLSSGARRDFTVGEMCNLLAVDTQKMFDTVWFANLIWACPLRVIITGALLWQYLGVACLAGFAVMILLMPGTGYLSRRTQILQGKQMTLKDSRLRQLNEIFNGVKVLKLFTWELPFMERVKGIRHKEVLILRRTAMYKAAVTFLWIFAPFLIAICSFVTFVLISEDNVLTPSIAFVSLTLFTTLRQTLSVIPEVTSKLVQSHISLRRLEKFLLSEELNLDSIGTEPSEGKSIVISNGTFSWSSEEPPYLKDIQITVPEGSLVAVVGPVGSGKSALLSALLGEMHTIEGSVNVKGSVAYVAQQAWIQNATLQNNILFLKDMDRSKYEKILDMCCLKPDLKILPAGDLTEIGEKGVNLSGGQKQRVSLARAVYQNCDVYILDDPLSAVDSHVGTHIFNYVIGPKGTLKDKTRILVTHDLSILPTVDQILVMDGGRIVESGKYDDLMKNKGGFSAFVEEHLKNIEEEVSSSEDTEMQKDESVQRDQMSTEDIKKQMIKLGSRLSRTHSSKQPSTARQKKELGRFIEQELMHVGRVKGDTYLSYFRHASYAFSITMLLSYAAYEAFEVGSSFWLSEWSTDVPLPDGSQNTDLRNTRITVYGLLGLGQGLCVLLATVVLAFASMRASLLFHTGMITSVLRSPMLFFDTTPIGRILNRFGKDINMVDVDIPEILNSIITSLMAVIGTLIVIAITNPLFIAIMIPLFIIYVSIQICYMRTSRQVRRLTAITLSPILSCFSETVQGTSTIRAFKAQDYFIGRQYTLLDSNARPFMNSAGLNRWLGIRLESIGCIVVFVAAMLVVAERETLNAGIVGLTLSYALSVSLALNTVVKHSTTLENRMISVERINEYSVLPSEDVWQRDSDGQVPKEWPTEGKITFQNYSMSYQKNSDYILRDINLEIKPREKVGIVGRTGAGKSSLALALFRTVEAADGSITIDEFDIASLGLHKLRAGITIIPQDPVLFSGPLRINLDPLQQHADVDLWNALDHAHLKVFVSSLENGLDYEVAEGGCNLSVGQRQQLCLARALLKRTKVLILDEATAAMDMETDKLIQSTIRNEFASSTVITIAHRLHTILDYDRIIVMDKGEVVEHGEPDALLQNQDTHFYRLGKDAGLL